MLANDLNGDAGELTIAAATSRPTARYGPRRVRAYEPNPTTATSPGGAPDDFTYTLNGGSEANGAVTVECAEDGPGRRR